LFDLDGTIIDSRALVISASAEALRRCAGLNVSEQAIAETLAVPVAERFRRFAADRVDELVALYTNLYAERIVAARPFSGVREMLTALRTGNVRCAVVTSRRRATAALTLQAHCLTAYFQAVICEEDVTAPKPAPDPVIAAARALESPVADAVMVGDSVLDLQSGRAAGARTGAALWGTQERDALLAFQPDYVFEDPVRVSDMIARPW
jgi:pyrophosphatase PpaX